MFCHIIILHSSGKNMGFWYDNIRSHYIDYANSFQRKMESIFLDRNEPLWY